MSEVRDLLESGTFKVILKEEPPDGEIKYEARYVIGGHLDRLKHYMVHGAQTQQTSSARLLFALAAAHDFEVWTSDVKMAYLQSTEPLPRPSMVECRGFQVNQILLGDE